MKEIKLNKHKYISEDEGAGLAAPIIDLFSSSLLIILSLWIIFESLKLKIPDNNLFTAPALLPIITASSLIIMLLIIFKKSLKSFSFLEINNLFKTVNYSKNLISPIILFFYIYCLTNFSFSYEINFLTLDLLIGPFLIFSTISISILLFIYWRKKVYICVFVSFLWSIFLSIIFYNFFNIPLPGN